MTRVFLVDDHPLVRGGLRAMLADEPDLLVVGEAEHGQALLDQLAAVPADVVLLDVNMPVLDGLATTRRLRAEFPEVFILVLSMLGHERYVCQLFEAGAHGYSLKNDEPEEILLAIHSVAAGRSYLCSELSLLLLAKEQRTQETGPAVVDAEATNHYNLSPRELEVMRLLTEGLTNADIADQLGTSKRTVETLRQQLFTKTGTKNAAALVRLAVGQGIVR
ncbi:MAG TPA: response regulator transcription factor [Hymenobacter sp.]|uniref:response regulator transcription factor n=1 Tax=Hymenobacter sp. TaxID=1898978 RepID=UPI002D803536|nr:response regulator transcription factor [Hymenobacter sp.]HET9505014.1 response regulator transcription factor [Hymenobacter sp.]